MAQIDPALAAQVLALIQKVADLKRCDDPGETCEGDSGPYCQTHGDNDLHDEILEARALLAELRRTHFG